MIDLEFDTPGEAETFVSAIRQLWGQVQGSLIDAPQARIAESVETKTL